MYGVRVREHVSVTNLINLYVSTNLNYRKPYFFETWLKKCLTSDRRPVFIAVYYNLHVLVGYNPCSIIEKFEILIQFTL